MSIENKLTLIQLLKKSFFNLFHLGTVQATNILLQLVLIPLVVKRVGLEANGYVLTALSIAGFFSIFVNYASNQTGPIEIRLSKLSETSNANISALLNIRLIFFFVFVVGVFSLFFFDIPSVLFLMGIIPLVFAEVINPYVYFLGLEELKYYNLANLFARVAALVLVYYFINHLGDAPWVNALVGLAQVSGFLFLWGILIFKHKIKWITFSFANIIDSLKQNLPLTLSNVAVHLQQSIFLYGLGFMGNPVVLGAYAIADKLIWGARMVLIAFSNAIYPAAIEVFHRSNEEWILFRKQVNKILTVFLILIGVLIFFFAHFIAMILSEKDDLELVERFIRLISPVPLAIGLNALNVMELLMKKMFSTQLQLSIQIFIISVLIAAISLFILPPNLSILYLLIIEITCLIFYEKNRRYNR